MLETSSVRSLWPIEIDIVVCSCQGGKEVQDAGF